MKNNLRDKFYYKLKVIICLLFFTAVITSNTVAQATVPGDGSTPTLIDININGGQDSNEVVGTLQVMILITLISLAPSLLIMLTSFTRIIIVLHFTRSALSTQQTPPNQVIIGLALFITFFIMSPVFSEINENAIKPFTAGEINQEEAFSRGFEPIRDFMINKAKVNDKDLRLFLDIAGIEYIDSLEDDIPATVLIPAFILSELRAAFILGFLIYIPFIVIDMVVASTLMAMGMMMLPPVMISMPFKILLFILADGWNLIIGELVKTFM